MNGRIALALLLSGVVSLLVAGPAAAVATERAGAGLAGIAAQGGAPRGGPGGPPPAPISIPPASMGGPCQLGALGCAAPTITILRPPSSTSATAAAPQPAPQVTATPTVDVLPPPTALPPTPSGPTPAAPPAAPTTSGATTGQPEPPTIQLRFGDLRFDGIRGAYCWQPGPPAGVTNPPTPGLCVDSPVSTFDTVLAWPSGTPVEFVVNGPAPTELNLAVATRSTDPLTLQVALPPSTAVSWTPSVPPGAYVLMLSARWPEGDAIYYFPIGFPDSAVPGPANSVPPSGPANSAPPPAASSPTPTVPPAAALSATDPPRPADPMPPAPPPTATPVPSAGGSQSAPIAAADTASRTTAPGSRPAAGSPAALTSSATEAPAATTSNATTGATGAATTPARVSSAAEPARAASPPASAVSPAPAGRVLLSDDFSDPASGWPRQTRDPSTRQIGYGSGGYTVARFPGAGGAVFVARPERFADFQAEVEGQLVPPTLGSYLFLDFRRQDSGDYYSFLVDPNERAFLLVRHSGSANARLVDWTSTDAIRPGVAANRLGVRAQGPDLVLLVNGQEVGRARDAALAEGRVGFGVGSLSDGRAEGRFTRVLVTGLD